MITRIKAITSHSGFRRYGANTLWLFGERILRMFVGLFVGVWITRYLGPEQFGIWSYVQSFVGLISVIAGLGLDSILIRELVKDERKRDELLMTAFWMKICGAFLAISIIGLSTLFMSNGSYVNTLIFIFASSIVFQAFNVIDFYFQSKVISKYVVYVNLIGLLLSNAVKITLVLSNAPLIAFVWTALFDGIVITIGMIYFYVQYTKSDLLHVFQTFHMQRTAAIELLKESWPLILSGLVVAVYLKIDQIMIMKMMDATSVGIYSASIRLSEIWYFIPTIIASSLWPSLITAREKDIKLYEARLLALLKFLFLISLAIVLVLVPFSMQLLDLLYGKEFVGGSLVLSIHIIGSIFAFSGIAASNWFILENLQKMTLRRTAAGAIINIILNLILIPIYGIVGAAIATLISQIVASYLFNAFNIKTRRLFVLQSKAFLLRKGM
ncbi:MAG: flippase [Sulfuricurvum sp.]|jgi:O-antigen/teichoic acid export membrane protein